MTKITKKQIDMHTTATKDDTVGGTRIHTYVFNDRNDDDTVVELIGTIHGVGHIVVAQGTYVKSRPAYGNEIWSKSRQIAIDEIYSMVN